MPSLLSRVIESQGQEVEIFPSRTGYSQVQVMKAGPCTLMIAFGIGDGLWFPN